MPFDPGKKQDLTPEAGYRKRILALCTIGDTDAQIAYGRFLIAKPKRGQVLPFDSGKKQDLTPSPQRYDACMSSKPSLWQARWQVDQAENLAAHDCGLRVSLQDGKGVAENADEIVASFVPKHGAHNASAMVQRLVREGAQLLIDPYSRGWRGGS